MNCLEIGKVYKSRSTLLNWDDKLLLESGEKVFVKTVFASEPHYEHWFVLEKSNGQIVYAPFSTFDENFERAS